ncbi:hypothetical protein BH10PSE12_BH10PSE12_25620 [soil metagenome]
MAYENDRGTVTRAGSSTGKTIAIIIVALAVIAGILFATGFWSADVKEGALPEVSVKGGALPDVDVDSKKVVVGTKSTTVEVPTVETKKTEIDVPVVGVKDNN